MVENRIREKRKNTTIITKISLTKTQYDTLYSSLSVKMHNRPIISSIYQKLTLFFLCFCDCMANKDF